MPPQIGQFGLPADNLNRLLIYPAAFDTPIVVGHPPIELYSIPTAELLRLLQRSEGYRVQPEPISVQVDPSATDRFTVAATDLGSRLHHHNGFAAT